MEDDLDAIATGDGSKVDYLHKFWRADGALSHKIDKTLDDIELGQARSIVLPGLPEGMEVRVGKYGPYVRFEKDAATGATHAHALPELDAYLSMAEVAPLELGD